MATSKNIDVLHKQQAAAAKEQFEMYKEFIVNEFVRKFGGSYQMPKDHMKTWRKTFAWTPEREEFLKQKTKDFLNLLPSNLKIFYSPKCLRVLIIDIATYLSIYTCRQEEKNLKPGEYPKRDKYSDALFQFLFTNNAMVQKKIAKYNEYHAKVYAGIKKSQHEYEQKKEKREKRKRIEAARKEFAKTGKKPTDVDISHTPEEFAKIKRELRAVEQSLSQNEYC